MAVVSLWHIKGNLKDLIDYVENPNKTVPKEMNDFFNVFSYIQRPEATNKEQYVTAVNCLKETALKQMIITKKRFGKTDKYIAWHGYQSFKIGEIDPDTAHEIGIKLVKEMWGDRFQIIVTTHLDKEHIHNHFCFNSVSFRDGKKYNYTKSEIQRLRDTSDNLCREYNLSVIEKSSKSPTRPVWLDEKEGKATRYNVYRSDIEEAVRCSRNKDKFEKCLIKLGYEVDFTGKHWKMKLPKYEHFTRLDTLNKEWTPEYFEERFYQTPSFMAGFSTYANLSPKLMPRDIQSAYSPLKKTSHIHKLYLYYCYQLGILPKGTNYKPTSPYLKEDLRFLDKLTQQVDYMAKNKIETMDDLISRRSSLQNDMEVLTDKRTKLQNKIRRASPEEKVKLREEKAKVTEAITIIRKDLKCNFDIEKRSYDIQKKLDMAFQNDARVRESKNKSRERSYR